jgi:hypothetical protein
LCGAQIGLVYLDARRGHAMEARHVVLVHMAEDDQIDIVEVGPDPVGGLRRIKGDPQIRPADDDLIAVGIFSRFVSEMDVDCAKALDFAQFISSGGDHQAYPITVAVPPAPTFGSLALQADKRAETSRSSALKASRHWALCHS